MLAMAHFRHYTKTEKGMDEIGQRRNNLRGKMRTMLILVDASKTAEELRLQAERIGVSPDFLDVMVREGYVTPIGPGAAAAVAANSDSATTSLPGDEVGQFRAAKSFMNETVVNALGFRAFLFTLRLERCSTRVDLAELLPDYEKAIRKGAAEAEAKTLIDRMHELLA